MFHVLAGGKQQREGGQGGDVLLCNKQQLGENISGHQGLKDKGVTQGQGLLGGTGGVWARPVRVDEGEEKSAWLGPHHFLILHLIFPYPFVSLLRSFVLHANLLFYYLWRWLHNTIKEKESTFPTCSVVLALLTVF